MIHLSTHSFKPRKLKPSSSLSAPTHGSSPVNVFGVLNPIFSMARKSSLVKQSLVAITLFLIALYAFFSTTLTPAVTPKFDIVGASNSVSTASFSSREASSFDSNPLQSPGSKARVYMYDLPRKFTYGIIKQHALARGANVDSSSLKYPGHQHMAEWHLFTDLVRPERERTGSPVVRVAHPDEADLFYVPVFSSLSLIVNPVRSVSGSGPTYSDEEMQEELMEWLEGQEYWRRNNGRDHVIIAQDPNALYKLIDRIKNAVLLVSDFGRLRGDQASLVKDVILPYSHRIRFYEGDIGVENRHTLLFFMGNRYRKEGGKIRDLLFQILENENDVIMKHGAQSRESRRAASQGMHSSKFCLHPAGDTPSACRLFDAIVSMCIPVIVSDSIELPFEDAIDYREIAIFVETSTALKPGKLVEMLRKVPTERILEYQKELRKVRRYYDYDHPNGTVNEIWRQVAQKLSLIKLMINREKRLVKRLSGQDCSCACTNRTGITT